ncbi:MAG: hypothetical protein ACHQW9_00035 [Nitrososphaerales archaeon]
MTDIPFTVKLLHSLGLVKVTESKKQDQTQKVSEGSSMFDGFIGKRQGVMPKDFGINKPVTPKRKGTFTFKASYILIFLPIILMTIPLLLPSHNNQSPISTGSAPPIDLTPVNDKYTDAQIIAKYPQLTDLDRALVSGELKLDQVSDAMRGMIKQQKLGEFHTP